MLKIFSTNIFLLFYCITVFYLHSMKENVFMKVIPENELVIEINIIKLLNNQP